MQVGIVSFGAASGCALVEVSQPRNESIRALVNSQNVIFENIWVSTHSSIDTFMSICSGRLHGCCFLLRLDPISDQQRGLL